MEFRAQCLHPHDLFGERARGDDGLGAGSRRYRQFAGARLANDFGIALQIVVRPNQQQGIGKIAWRGQRAAGIFDVAPELPARFTQARDVVRGKARNVPRSDAKRIRKPFELSRVLRHFRSGILRVDALSPQIDTGKIEFRPAPEIGIDAFQSAVQAIDRLYETIDLTVRRHRVEALHFGGYLADRALELDDPVLFGSKQRKRERSYFRRQLIAQHRECRVAHRSHQHAAPVREPVTDNIGNGVRFAGSGRALDDHSVRGLQHLHDARLLVVERLGKEQVLRFRGLARAASMVGRRHTAVQRQPGRCRNARRFGNQCRNGFRQPALLVER